MKSGKIMYKISIFVILVILQNVFSQNVVLNEIMSSNSTTLSDEDGDYPDWVELYNAGSEPVDLSGYGLSDDTLNTKKWMFGSVSINPGEYLIVFASDKDRNGLTLHTNFKISASGERILLSEVK